MLNFRVSLANETHAWIILDSLSVAFVAAAHSFDNMIRDCHLQVMSSNQQHCFIVQVLERFEWCM